MTVYTAQCRHDADQILKAYQNGVSVIFDAYADDENVTSPYLSPADARTFARGILALADEVDGGEKAEKAATEEPTEIVKVGDRVVIVEDTADFMVGRRGKVVRVDANDSVLPYCLLLDNGHGPYEWWTASVRKVDDSLAASEAATYPAPPVTPSRAAFLEQAADLMINSQTYTATDLTELADYLAGEK